MRKYTLISILLVLISGSFACASSQDSPQQTAGTPALSTLPSPTATPTASPIPRRTSGAIAISNIATATPVSNAVAASNIPFPSPTPTSTPEPTATSTATVIPNPSPTSTATQVPPSEEDIQKVEDFYDNFVSISYEAVFDLPSDFAESDYDISATAHGWLTMRTDDDASQIFTGIEMTSPITRSIEVVSRPATFDMFLHDLDANKWYFLPENSPDANDGPLQDIMSFASLGMFYSALPHGGIPTDELKQTVDGYIWKVEEPSFGSVAVTYDQSYNLETFTLADTDGKKLIQVRYFDLNKLHTLVHYEDVDELLPADYWQSQ